MLLRILAYFIALQTSLLASQAIEGLVVARDASARTLELELSTATSSDWGAGDRQLFRVSRGDAEIDYSGRIIRANAVFYNNAWHLEQLFPVNGDGADAVAAVNQRFHQLTAGMRRGRFIRRGDAVPNFGMINQDGEFVQIHALQGKPYVLTFIFTRCAVANMCPATSTKMQELQEKARAEGPADLQFVIISFDPAFDSPGTLRTYARGYGMKLDNFHLLTYNQKLIDGLLRQFGILTLEEDGTINHTMATLLVDAEGRVAHRREGPNWRVDDFLQAAQAL